MRSHGKRAALAAPFLLIVLALSQTGQAETPDARAIVENSLRAFYYAGQDMKAHVSMSLVNPQGKTRSRRMTLLRRNQGERGDQKYYIFFHEPSEVKGTAFLVWKYPAKEDDRWIFIPSVNLVKRIAANDKRSSFVGSDFTYEDVSGRDAGDETHSLRGVEELDGRTCYVVESVPKSPADYARRTSWIDQEHYLPLKEEYVDARGVTTRVFTADEVAQVGGHWTVTKRTMKNLQTGHRTEVVFTDVAYDVGLNDDLFSERYLRQPPMGVLR